MTRLPFADLISDELGRVVDRGDGAFDIVLERRLRLAPAKVWAAITTPERIAAWFTDVEIELHLGGAYVIRFPQNGYRCEGRIVELEHERRLAHTWPDPAHPRSIVCYRLDPDDGGCRLALTQTALDPGTVPSIAGWHAFLEGLPAAVEGLAAPFRPERETELRDLYRYQFPA